MSARTTEEGSGAAAEPLQEHETKQHDVTPPDQLTVLYAALASAQGEMGLVELDGDNLHFRSRYASLGAVVQTVRGPLAKHGIAYLQIPEQGKGEVALTTWFLHKGGARLKAGTLTVTVDKPGPQALGSALRYARRYGLALACGVAEESDDSEAPPSQDEVSDIARKIGMALRKKDGQQLDELLAKAAQSEELRGQVWQKLSAAQREDLREMRPEKVGG